MAVLVKFFAAIGALATLTTAAFLVGKAVGPPPRAQVPPPTPAAPASSSPATPGPVGEGPMTVVPVTGVAGPAPTADHDPPGRRRAVEGTVSLQGRGRLTHGDTHAQHLVRAADDLRARPHHTHRRPTPAATGPASPTKPVEDDEPGHGHHD